MDYQTWGWHLSINASGCNREKINDFSTIYAFTKQLVKDIDMVAYGEPVIVHFGSGDKEGYTMTQLIETSNICAHFVPQYDALYLDVFSCKTFNPNLVEHLVRETFKTKWMSQRMQERCSLLFSNEGGALP